MAVVQISRIQQRRGKRNTQTGFPQLASGELGWAIDTQELYIGNGAVSEGAPAVGNTKVITEHDDVLALVGLYRYYRGDETNSIQTGELTTMPVNRTLQDRLDDIVSVRAFGCVGDGSDQTVALQRAIDELFLNDSTKNNVTSRVVLYMEPGVYLISDELRIPPYAHIVGAGIDSTIIVQTMVNSSGYGVFRTVAGDSTPGDYTAFTDMSSTDTMTNGEPTYPRKIFISGMTLKTTHNNTIMYLDNTELSVFDRIKFEGIFTNGSLSSSAQVGVNIRGTSKVFRTNAVTFRDCEFYKSGIGIFSGTKGDHENINIDSCRFVNLAGGIEVGGGSITSYGSIGTKVSNCYFDHIDQSGFRVKLGYGNSSVSNTFMNVGNNNNTDQDSGSLFPVISFETEGNTSTDDYFNRDHQLRKSTFNGYAYIPAIETNSMVHVNNGYTVRIDIASPLPQSLLRFSFYKSSVYIIDYVLNKDTEGVNGRAIRTGTLTVTTDMITKTGSLIDNYNYVGHISVERIEFSIEIQNNLDDSTHDTMAIKYVNPTGNGIGYMNYSYRTMTM